MHKVSTTSPPLSPPSPSTSPHLMLQRLLLHKVLQLRRADPWQTGRSAAAATAASTSSSSAAASSCQLALDELLQPRRQQGERRRRRTRGRQRRRGRAALEGLQSRRQHRRRRRHGREACRGVVRCASSRAAARGVHAAVAAPAPEQVCRQGRLQDLGQTEERKRCRTLVEHLSLRVLSKKTGEEGGGEDVIHLQPGSFY